MKFQPRSESTRQFIIECTAGIFNVKGYAGTSLSDLTEATKLTKGSIYGNFENKEDVVMAAFDYNASHQAKVVHDKVDSYSGYKDKLMVYATIYSTAENDVFPQGGCPLLNTGTEADDTHEPLRQRAADALMQLKNDIKALIEGGIEANEFLADVDANRLALSIVALLEGGILIGRTTRDSAHLDTILDTVKNMIKSIYVN